MITEAQIVTVIQEKLDAEELFLVDLHIAAGNKISITIDKMSGVSIEACIQISKLIEQNFDREVEDFELEVASAGIGYQFKVLKQYLKNIGKQVEVVTTAGVKLKGQLLDANSDGFTVSVESLVKVEGKKKKELQIIEHQFKFEEVKSVKDIFSF